jgi:16S rRNA G1207 methylase RsmC
MEEFKSNSHKSKEELQKKAPERKLEKVISGNAKQKKKTETRKFAEAFIKDDLGSIGSYIVTDVIVPAIKRTILDSVKALLGDTGGSRTATPASKISYRSYYDREDDRRKDYTTLAKAGYDYDDILFETRGDAEAVLDAMTDLVNSQYGIVSVGDLYDLANMTTDNYTINNYGWTNLQGAKVVPTRDGYMIKLPRALPLK